MDSGTCVKITAVQDSRYTFPVSYDRLVFSGGEVHVRLHSESICADSLHLTAHLRSAMDLMELLLVTDALRRACVNPRVAVHLVCPYLPYARQDRACAPGEALSLRVMCNLINSQGYDSVTVWDAHSDVATALLDRSVSRPVKALMPAYVPSGSLLIAPDAGAVKRVSAVAKEFGCQMVTAEKHRDPRNGQITGTACNLTVDMRRFDLLIVDDICDGGRTFIELAKVLPTHSKVNLWVTHGIFSQGFDCFRGLIDNIWTPNPFPTELPEFVHKVKVA